MRYFLHICLLMCACLSANAQTVLLDVPVDTLNDWGKTGPNRAHSTRLFLGMGTHFGGTMGALIRPEQSFDLQVGIRHRRKLNNTFSFMAGLYYNYTSIALDQDNYRIRRNQRVNGLESYRFHALGLESVFRVHFDKKRGNIMGRYLDLGASLAWNMSAEYHTSNLSSSGYTIRTTLVQPGIDNTKYFVGHVIARLGIGRFQLFSRFRLGEFWSGNEPQPGMVSAGLSVEI